MSPLLYRVFLVPLTVFFAFCAVLTGPGPVFAQEGDQYLVRGVTVDVSGPSALDARKAAFAEARRKAYEQLADRLLPAGDRPNLVVPDDRAIASMVRDFEIVNEKMTSRRYAGTVDIRFTPAAVKRAMQASVAAQPTATQPQTNAQNATSATNTTTATDENGVTVTTTTSRTSTQRDDGYVYSPRRAGSVSTANNTAVPARASVPQRRGVLVLPWYGQTGRQTLWEQGNPWRAAWEEKISLSRDKSAAILLPVGDVDDLRDYAPPQPLSRRGNIDALLERYKAADAVLALAEPNSDGGVVVSLYRYENGAPVPMGRFGVDSSAQDVLGEAVSKAAASLKNLPAKPVVPTPVSIQSPESSVSVVPAPRTTGGGIYTALARFSGLQQWVAMRQALYRIPSITSMSVRSISPSQATVEFTYGGDYNALAPILAQNGITIMPLPAGAVTAAPGAGAPAQYILSMGGVY